MDIRFSHPWNLTPGDAVALQKELRDRLILEDRLPRDWSLVAGVDVSYSRCSPLCHAAIVVLRFPGGEVVEEASAERLMEFPYVPGLLTFREGPAVIEAAARLACEPDVLLFDGQGIAHPRRFGLAAHLGLLFDRPSIGCAKTILVGRHEPVGEEPGRFASLVHEGQTIGAAVRTKRRARPVYVSPGHRVALPTAIHVVLSCCRGYRIPEPTRLAHQVVNRLRRERETPA